VQEDEHLRLEVQDWGVGFSPDAIAADRFGIEGIRERARLLGGQVAIESQPGVGTLIRATLPLVEPEFSNCKRS
jgi:signal transduction histidine kinase